MHSNMLLESCISLPVGGFVSTFFRPSPLPCQHHDAAGLGQHTYIHTYIYIKSKVVTHISTTITTFFFLISKYLEMNSNEVLQMPREFHPLRELISPNLVCMYVCVYVCMYIYVCVSVTLKSFLSN